MKNAFLTWIIGAAVSLLATAAAAQDYPTKSITVVVPFAVGGPTDLSARLVATSISKDPAFTVIVENVPGAGAVIGATRAAQAKPDGYTLLWGSASSLAMSPVLYENVKYDPIKSFAPVGLVASQPFVLVVRPSLGVKSLAEFVALAKASPSKLNYSSTGQGASAHLVAELFQTAAGIKATHIPYNGGAPAMNALLASDVDFLFDTTTTTVPMVKSGKVLVLAVGSATRWPGLPNTPTFQELGYVNFEATTWFALLAPAGTPPGIVATLNQKLVAALHDPAVVSALQNAGFSIEPSTPSQLASRIGSDVTRWGAIIKAANVKLN